MYRIVDKSGRAFAKFFGIADALATLFIPKFLLALLAALGASVTFVFALTFAIKIVKYLKSPNYKPFDLAIRIPDCNFL